MSKDISKGTKRKQKLNFHEFFYEIEIVIFDDFSTFRNDSFSFVSINAVISRRVHWSEISDWGKRWQFEFEFVLNEIRWLSCSFGNFQYYQSRPGSALQAIGIRSTEIPLHFPWQVEKFSAFSIVYKPKLNFLKLRLECRLERVNFSGAQLFRKWKGWERKNWLSANGVEAWKLWERKKHGIAKIGWVQMLWKRKICGSEKFMGAQLLWKRKSCGSVKFTGAQKSVESKCYGSVKALGV